MSNLSLNELEAQVREVEKRVLESTGFTFEKAIVTSEEDRKNGFLPSTGHSWFMKIIHPPGRKSTHRGIWMMNKENRLLILFLSYDRGVHWVLDLTENPRTLSNHLGDIASSQEFKYVEYHDGTIGIWRDVYKYEDIFW